MDTRIKLNDFLPPELNGVPSWSIRLRGTFMPGSSGTFQFGLTVAGRAKLFVEDELLIDNWTHQRPGDFFYGQGTVEEIGELEVKEGNGIRVEVVYSNTSPEEGKGERDLSQPALMLGVVSRVERSESRWFSVSSFFSGFWDGRDSEERRRSILMRR